MLLPLFYIFIAAYLVVRGGREAGFWATPSILEGLLMLASGACLLLAQLF